MYYPCCENKGSDQLHTKKKKKKKKGFLMQLIYEVSHSSKIIVMLVLIFIWPLTRKEYQIEYIFIVIRNCKNVCMDKLMILMYIGYKAITLSESDCVNVHADLSIQRLLDVLPHFKTCPWVFQPGFSNQIQQKLASTVAKEYQKFEIADLHLCYYICNQKMCL